MNSGETQRAFDLLASLVEEGATCGWESPVLEAAERLCNEWRAQGVIRHRYAVDYHWLSPGDDNEHTRTSTAVRPSTRSRLSWQPPYPLPPDVAQR